eukprot:c35039_g1_i1.p1 GENE.c35039_g1_i1~~c35039_g1_i1.p1  ORF type:complete len:134 (+),score=29.66 c35039_g1_i1:77-478(+)
MAKYEDPSIKAKATLVGIVEGVLTSTSELGVGVTEGRNLHTDSLKLCRDFAGHDATLANSDDMLTSLALAVKEMGHAITAIAESSAVIPKLHHQVRDAARVRRLDPAPSAEAAEGADSAIGAAPAAVASLIDA